MADIQPNESDTVEQRVVPVSVVDLIPDELRNDPFVWSIARQCDYLKDDVDRGRAQLKSEQESHKQTRTGLYDALDRGLKQAVELEKANAVIAKRDQLTAMMPTIYWLAVVALIVVMGTVQVVFAR